MCGIDGRRGSRNQRLREREREREERLEMGSRALGRRVVLGRQLVRRCRVWNPGFVEAKHLEREVFETQFHFRSRGLAEWR